MVRAAFFFPCAAWPLEACTILRWLSTAAWPAVPSSGRRLVPVTFLRPRPSASDLGQSASVHPSSALTGLPGNPGVNLRQWPRMGPLPSQQSCCACLPEPPAWFPTRSGLRSAAVGLTPPLRPLACASAADPRRVSAAAKNSGFQMLPRVPPRQARVRTWQSQPSQRMAAGPKCSRPWAALLRASVVAPPFPGATWCATSVLLPSLRGWTLPLRCLPSGRLLASPAGWPRSPLLARPVAFARDRWPGRLEAGPGPWWLSRPPSSFLPGFVPGPALRTLSLLWPPSPAMQQHPS